MLHDDKTSSSSLHHQRYFDKKQNGEMVRKLKMLKEHIEYYASKVSDISRIRDNGLQITYFK